MAPALAARVEIRADAGVSEPPPVRAGRRVAENTVAGMRGRRSAIAVIVLTLSLFAMIRLPLVETLRKAIPSRWAVIGASSPNRRNAFLKKAQSAAAAEL